MSGTEIIPERERANDEHRGFVPGLDYSIQEIGQFLQGRSTPTPT